MKLIEALFIVLIVLASMLLFMLFEALHEIIAIKDAYRELKAESPCYIGQEFIPEKFPNVTAIEVCNGKNTGNVTYQINWSAISHGGNPYGR